MMKKIFKKIIKVHSSYLLEMKSLKKNLIKFKIKYRQIKIWVIIVSKRIILKIKKKNKKK